MKRILKRFVTFVVDSVLLLWALVKFVGVVTFLGSTKVSCLENRLSCPCDIPQRSLKILSLQVFVLGKFFEILFLLFHKIH